MDRELNNGTIGYIIYTDKSLREKEESICKVGRVFPRHVPYTYLTGELPLSRPRVAYTLRVMEPYSRNYGGSYYWARYVGKNSVNNVIITGGVVA